MKPLIFILLFIIPGFINAQNLTMGPELSEPAGSVMDGLVYVDESGHVVQRLKRRGILGSYPLLERFDSGLKLSTSAEIPLEYMEKNLDYIQTVDGKGSMFVLSNFVNQKEDKNYLFSQEIDPVSLKPIGDLQKICEVPIVSKGNSGGFTAVASEDRSKIAVFANTYFRKGEPERYVIQVHANQGMVKLWSKEITLPFEDQLFKVERMLVDNEGKFYITAKLAYDKPVTERHGEPNYKYVVYVYSPNDAQPYEYEISLGDLFITDFTFKVNSAGDLVCAGFISENGTNSIKGICYFTVDGKTQLVKSKSVKEFGIDFMEEFMSEKKAAKGKELYQYDLRNIVTRDDGGAILLAEEHYMYSTISRDPTTRITTFTYHYFYNHIIVTSVGPDGQIQWCIKVPKFQYTTNDGGYYSSFASAVKSGNVYLVFNDNPKNLLEKESSRLFRYNRYSSVAVLVTITPEGEYSKKLLFENREEGIIMRPKVCRQQNPGDPMLLFGELGRGYKFAWLEL